MKICVESFKEDEDLWEPFIEEIILPEVVIEEHKIPHKKKTHSFHEYKELKPQQQKEYFMKAKNFLRDKVLDEIKNNINPPITMDMINKANAEEICFWFDKFYKEEKI